MASSPFFVRHDLTHIAVESELGLCHAFCGLVAEGWDLSHFEEREPNSTKSRALPPEALFAEQIVGFLDCYLSNGQIREHLGAVHGPSDEQLDSVRASRDELLARFAALSPGEVLELEFPL